MESKDRLVTLREANASLHGATGEMLTTDEVCAWLKVKKSWVYDACRDRGLPVFRLGGTGGSLRFQRSEVVAWLLEFRRTS